MIDSQGITLGHISYLNCVPFFYYLRDCGFNGKLVSGVPSVLNRMLQTGQIDVSPSSSFEYALHSNEYYLLPDFSISSTGPVKSVLLFSPCELDKLTEFDIALTGESATSINLLRVLLHEFWNFPTINNYISDRPVEEVISDRQPGLLIGDRALHQADNLPDGMQCFDLGDLWYQSTGLPFVFALWILRRDSAYKKAGKINDLFNQLHRSLNLALDDLRSLAEKTGVHGQELDKRVSYWKGMDFNLSDKHVEGLTLFYRLCAKYSLLKQEPEIQFYANKKD